MGIVLTYKLILLLLICIISRIHKLILSIWYNWMSTWFVLLLIYLMWRKTLFPCHFFISIAGWIIRRPHHTISFLFSPWSKPPLGLPFISSVKSLLQLISIHVVEAWLSLWDCQPSGFWSCLLYIFLFFNWLLLDPCSPGFLRGKLFWLRIFLQNKVRKWYILLAMLFQLTPETLFMAVRFLDFIILNDHMGNISLFELFLGIHYLLGNHLGICIVVVFQSF